MSKVNELAKKEYPTEGCFRTEVEPISEYQLQVELQCAFRRGYETALTQEPKQTVNQDVLEALKGAETHLEFYLDVRRESDARIADRDGYGDDYVSRHTRDVERDLNAVKTAIKKAGE